MLRNGRLRYILYTCPKSIVIMNLTTCTHGAHKIHSGKTAKDLYLTTCTHGAHNIHRCKNKGVHTAKPFRVYRRGPWPRVQMRPLTACTDEPLRPWPEPSACTCDPGPEPSACTCDPRKRVHRRPPDRKNREIIYTSTSMTSVNDSKSRLPWKNGCRFFHPTSKNSGLFQVL